MNGHPARWLVVWRDILHTIVSHCQSALHAWSDLPRCCLQFLYVGVSPSRCPWRQVVEHADEIESPPAGSVMEAFWYMVREGGLWESLEGASEWVAEFLLR